MSLNTEDLTGLYCTKLKEIVTFLIFLSGNKMIELKEQEKVDNYNELGGK